MGQGALGEAKQATERTDVAHITPGEERLQVIAVEQGLRDEAIALWKAHTRRTGGRSGEIVEGRGGAHPEAAGKELHARLPPERHDTAVAAAPEAGAGPGQREGRDCGHAVDLKIEGPARIVAARDEARALPGGIPHAAEQLSILARALQGHLGPVASREGAGRRRTLASCSQIAREQDLPGRAPPWPRAHRDPRRLEAQHGPESDAEAPRVAASFLVRRVQGAQEATCVCEGHAEAIVPTDDARAPAVDADLEVRTPGAGVARVLHQLPDEDEGIVAIAARLVEGTLAEVHPSLLPGVPAQTEGHVLCCAGHWPGRKPRVEALLAAQAAEIERLAVAHAGSRCTVGWHGHAADRIDLATLGREGVSTHGRFVGISPQHERAVQHVHSASESVAAGRLAGKVDAGRRERRQVAPHPEVGEHHLLGAGRLLLPVEQEPQRDPRPGDDTIGRVTTLHGDADLLYSAHVRCGRLVGPPRDEEVPEDGGDEQQSREVHEQDVESHGISAWRRRSALETTVTELSDIAAPAASGDSNAFAPSHGTSAPVASAIAITL